MSFDENLAARVRRLLKRKAGYSEGKMFGGLCFMLNGNMCGGVLGDDLIVRIMPDEYAAALKRPHTRQFDFTGKPAEGFRDSSAASHPDGHIAQELDSPGNPVRQIAAGKNRPEKAAP